MISEYRVDELFLIEKGCLPIIFCFLKLAVFKQILKDWMLYISEKIEINQQAMGQSKPLPVLSVKFYWKSVISIHLHLSIAAQTLQW